MMPRKPPLNPGDQIACYTVLQLEEDATNDKLRTYRLQANCCGMEVLRQMDTLRSAVRKGQQRCHMCSAEQRRTQVGEVFGHATIIAKDPAFHQWRVRWDCCGAEEVVPRSLLALIRYRASYRQTVCSQCTAKIEQGLEVPVIEEDLFAPNVVIEEQFDAGVLSAALAWPVPQSARRAHAGA